MGMNEFFRKFSNRTSALVGSPWAFILAVLIIVAWMVTGPLFHFSDTWQLVINTGTTIITFLMVFLIQNTQNRDAKAIHLKLDELIRSQSGARNFLVDLESLSDEEMQRLQEEFQRFRERHAEPEENLEEVLDAPEDAEKTVKAIHETLRKKNSHKGERKDNGVKT
jgi:low affinity Fe/Cu permease